MTGLYFTATLGGVTIGALLGHRYVTHLTVEYDTNPCHISL
jgi:hypothetical protein